jgi:hypothetical protein
VCKIVKETPKIVLVTSGGFVQVFGYCLYFR